MISSIFRQNTVIIDPDKTQVIIFVGHYSIDLF